MKRFAILLSVALILLVVIVVYENTDLVNDEPTLSTTASTEAACVEHKFSEATFISPRKCEICEATEGEPLSMRCETWEEVIALAGFDEYSYELSVTDCDNCILLTLAFDDSDHFTNEDSVSNFMLRSYLVLMEVTWFTQNRLSVETPDRFQIDTLISLDFPGGSITCLPVDTYSPIGFTTSLHVDEDSPQKFMIERLYNRFFESVALPEAS